MANNIVLYGKYKSLRVLLQMWMETMLPNYYIIEANDVHQVMDFAEKYSPLALLIDIDSFSPLEIETVKKIKTSVPKVPMVVITNNGLQDDIQATFMPGADTCLSLETFQEQIPFLLLNLVQGEPVAKKQEPRLHRYT